jgi:phosphohistidine phosphatase SixA
VRALQTAEIVAAVTELEKRVREAKDAGGAPGAVEIRREMAPGGDSLSLVFELVRSGRKRAMVVGHEPDVSMLVSRLVGRHPPQGMLKSMVVGVKVETSKEGGVSRGSQTSHPEGIHCDFRFILDPKTLHWQRD